MTRPALALGAVTIRADGQVLVTTPPDPQTGSESVVLDSLDFVHAVVTQIPDARTHLLRYSGAYSARWRGRLRAAGSPAAAAAGSPEPVTPAEPLSPEAKRRSSWARVLARVFEVDPLRCPRCSTKVKGIAWITDPVVIERILAHRRKAGLESPFDARGPPVAG